MPPTPPGLLVSAPASGVGKTTVTLGLLRALRDDGLAVQGFKSGPDYIDPAFHRAASGRDSFNLDTWAMGPALLAAIVDRASGADIGVAEGAMGLFDGVEWPGRSGGGTAAEDAERPAERAEEASSAAALLLLGLAPRRALRLAIRLPAGLAAALALLFAASLGVLLPLPLLFRRLLPRERGGVGGRERRVAHRHAQVR